LRRKATTRTKNWPNVQEDHGLSEDSRSNGRRKKIIAGQKKGNKEDGRRTNEMKKDANLGKILVARGRAKLGDGRDAP